jgi:hypothetical protein
MIATPSEPPIMMECQPAGTGSVIRDDTAVVALVSRAARGGQHACNDAVDRHAPYLYTICNRYRLCHHHLEDVRPNAWSSAYGALAEDERIMDLRGGEPDA